MSLPTLTVAMPNFNHARFIPESLQAVLDQSVRPVEVLFIDDASTDNSLEVVGSYARRDGVIRVIRNETNRGVNANMNRALAMARGDYFVGVACDDRVLPGFFEASLTLLARHPKAGLCSGLSRMMDGSGNDLGVQPSLVAAGEPSYLAPERTRQILGAYGNWMLGNTTVYRRDALLAAGGFRPALHSFSDNFAAQVLALRHGACYLPVPVGVWRRTGSTYSGRCRADARVRGETDRTALRLMRTEFRRLFPDGYDRVWEREMAFEHARGELSRRLSAGCDGPDTPEAGAPRRIGLAAGWARRLPAALATSYLVLRHRPVQSVRRRLRMTFSGGLGAAAVRP
jgi:glycosyltransferase involved in cell wall biosynthesis